MAYNGMGYVGTRPTSPDITVTLGWSPDDFTKAQEIAQGIGYKIVPVPEVVGNNESSIRTGIYLNENQDVSRLYGALAGEGLIDIPGRIGHRI